MDLAKRALGYVAPAKQSTGANEVSEADERLAKCGTADPNEVRVTPKNASLLFANSVSNRRLRQETFDFGGNMDFVTLNNGVKMHRSLCSLNEFQKTETRANI